MTQRTTLRPVREEDLPVFFEHQQDPQACQMAGFPSRAYDAFMTHWAKNMTNPANHHYTIEEDGQVVGNIISYVQHGEREVGYWIGREHWGRGIATRALALCLTLETERPLSAHVLRSNIGSQRVLEKCGFERVGEESEEYIYVLR